MGAGGFQKAWEKVGKAISDIDICDIGIAASSIVYSHIQTPPAPVYRSANALHLLFTLLSVKPDFFRQLLLTLFSEDTLQATKGNICGRIARHSQGNELNEKIGPHRTIFAGALSGECL